MDDKVEKPKDLYWIGIIGPADRNKIPSGADSPMRKAVQKEFENLVDDVEYDCWSGWGIDYEMTKRLQRVESLSLVNSRQLEMIDTILDHKKFKDIERLYDDWLKYNKQIIEYAENGNA